MPKIQTSIFILALLVCTVAYAAESDTPQKGNTHSSDAGVTVPVSIMYTQRAISGGFEVDPSGMTSGRATTESLGLDKATAIQFAVAVNWKKWNFGFTYLPSTFTGEGYSEERLDFEDGNYIEPDIKVRTDISVELYLGSVLYNFLNWKGLELGAGFGAGSAKYDLEIIPRLGPGGLQSDGTTPFGYLSFNAVWRYKKFLLGGRVDALEVNISGETVGYKDLNLMAGYRMPYKKIPINILAGYRWNSLDLTFDDGSSKFGMDIELKGPYMGVNAVF